MTYESRITHGTQCVRIFRCGTARHVARSRASKGIVSRMLVLTTAGGITAFVYTWLAFVVLGSGFHASVAAIATTVGGLLSAGCGVFLGGRLKRLSRSDRRRSR